MSSRAGGTSASAQDIRLLLEQIVEDCGKIARVTKKGVPQLVDLCTTLRNRLGDRPAAQEQLNYEDVKSELVVIEKRLAGWASSPWGLMKKKEIETGVIKFVGQLESIVAIPEQDIPENRSIKGKEPSPIRRLDREVEREGEMAFAGGVNCEVWMGLWEKAGGGKAGDKGAGKDAERVALKALRPLKSPEKARKRLECELPTWAELRHKNILPLYGIVTDIDTRVFMVTPWRENGNLLVYVKNNPQVDKNHLLRGSAAGLNYLHKRNIVHGGVKCKNVLVSQDGEPQICDFGISRIVEEASENTVSRTVSSGDVVRYAAPELIENTNAPATKDSDTYSFAMLILECITEETPFHNLPRDAAVIHARISKRQFPPRPDGPDQRNRISEDLWELMIRCWAFIPDQRPAMEQVHNFFLYQDPHYYTTVTSTPPSPSPSPSLPPTSSNLAVPSLRPRRHSGIIGFFKERVGYSP